MSGLANQFLAAGREGAKSFNQGFTEGMKGVSIPSDGSILGEVIAGKPVGTATRTAAQKAGKEIGTGLNTGIQEGMKTAPTTTGGGVLSDAISGKPVSSATKSAAQDLGKEVGKSINEGIEAATRDNKSRFASAFNEIADAIGPELSAQIGGAIGQAVGEGIREIPGMADAIDTVRDAAGHAADAFTSVQDSIKALKSGDVSGALTGVSGSLDHIDSLAKGIGIDLGGWTGPAKDSLDKVDKMSTDFQGLKGDIHDFAGVVEAVSPGIAAAIGEWAGPLALAAVAGKELADYTWPKIQGMPGFGSGERFLEQFGLHAPGAERFNVPPAGAGVTSPVPAQPGVPIVPGAGQAPAAAPGLVPAPTQTAPPSFAPFDTGFQYGGLAFGTDTVPAMLTPGEYIVNRGATNRFLPLLNAMNRYQTGGIVGAEAWASSQSGQPYTYGNLDCSGYIADIWGLITGHGLGHHFDTTAFASPDSAAKFGFVPGTMPGFFNIAVNPEPGMSGHMMGMFPDGTLVESGGADSKVKFGGHTSSFGGFEKHYYLKGFPQAPGGGAPAGMPGGGAGGGGGGAMPTAGAGGGGGGGPGGQELGQAMVQGMFQELGFPDVFGKPFTQWGSVKMGMAALNYGLGLAKKAGGLGGGPGAPADLASAVSGGAGGALGLPGTSLLGGGSNVHMDLRGATFAGAGAAKEITSLQTHASDALPPASGAAGLPR